MRLTRILSITLVVILFLGLAGGILWLLDFLAVINLGAGLAKIPVVGKLVYQSAYHSSGESNTVKKPLGIEQTPAEKENEKLKKENEDLKKGNKNFASEIEQAKRDNGTLAKQIEVLKKEKQNLVTERDNLNTMLLSLQESGTGQTQEMSYKKLAKIYAEMKPQAAVKIMENLSDEVVIGILLHLEDDQVAKILSAMTPQKAAILVDKMKE